MGPLVYYARWHGYRMRLQGRDGSIVWGLFINTAEEDKGEVFRFDSRTHELTLGEGENRRQVSLDEMGVVILRDDNPPFKTSSAVEP